jgi:hypothetical protein
LTTNRLVDIINIEVPGRKPGLQKELNAMLQAVIYNIASFKALVKHQQRKSLIINLIKSSIKSPFKSLIIPFNISVIPLKKSFLGGINL